ncbi:hypothetical protein OVA24_13595 [Luteolibacter sp. SL250]|uniref:hypothetical protein n=1 Tax=Luteolibacter sp. SL250 TaxID=2995170 RepID=UPI002271F119|nr:hypothetical protein [Luteolibacter sp. SL250]WAC18270.1 hypothetical protein OVA24_13595 [Luteolibacter sp. SL250]
MKPTHRLRAGSLALLLSAAGLSAQPMREAPHPGATPVNQLAIAGNACGPAALLSAFRFGGEGWRKAADAVDGENDRQRLRKIILEIGMRPSKSLGGRPRWSKAGVNIADLCDMANEMVGGPFLPDLEYEVMVTKPNEDHADLLERVHRRLEKSLAKGFPPVVGIRRFVKRKGTWLVIEAHFVTVISIPRKLEKGAAFFPVTYIDPWGGRRCEGRVAVSGRELVAADGRADPILSPSLEADFPQALVGKSRVAKGEVSLLTVSAAIVCR